MVCEFKFALTNSLEDACRSEIQKKIEHGIPNSIIKFFTYMDSESTLKQFRMMWHENKRRVFKSDVFQLNSRLVRLPEDFKKYFPSVVNLRQHREKDYFNDLLNFPLGIIFQIPHLDYIFIMKFIMIPGNRLCIKITNQSKIYNQPIN